MLTCGDLHQVGDLLHECTLHLLQGLDEGGGVTLSMLQRWLVFGQLLKGLTCGAQNRNEHPTMSALHCVLSDQHYKLTYMISLSLSLLKHNIHLS